MATQQQSIDKTVGQPFRIFLFFVCDLAIDFSICFGLYLFLLTKHGLGDGRIEDLQESDDGRRYD